MALKTCKHCRHSQMTLVSATRPWCLLHKCWAGKVCDQWEREPGIEG